MIVSVFVADALLPRSRKFVWSLIIKLYGMACYMGVSDAKAEDAGALTENARRSEAVRGGMLGLSSGKRLSYGLGHASGVLRKQRRVHSKCSSKRPRG
jgi:hypothetical protein